jgi:uncharacterized protein YkwD
VRFRRSFVPGKETLQLRGRPAEYFRVREVRQKLQIGLAALATLAVLSSPAPAEPPEEHRFLELINASRAAAGLAPLALEPNLVGFARSHTADMLAQGDVFHSGREARLANAPSGWRLLGENVGMGSSPERLHAAFMQSTGHRANILGDFDHLAVGVGRGDNGRLYVTVVFVKFPGADARHAARVIAPPDRLAANAHIAAIMTGLDGNDLGPRD